MRAAELKNKKIAIWGLGHEGKAAAHFIRRFLPDQPLIFLDEAEGADKIAGLTGDYRIARGAAIAEALRQVDILIKSPGVSLYHPLIQTFKAQNKPVTSLLNLWIAEPHATKIICVTGTKGKSTTSSLLAHTLNALGKKAELGGNIGVPVAELRGNDDYAVIEVSSYQATDFAGSCDMAVLTSLHPEHLDWHGSKERYFDDKLNLLRRAKTRIVNQETLPILKQNGIEGDVLIFNQPQGLHFRDGKIYDGGQLIGSPQNPHLARPHNLSNMCAVLTVIKLLGMDVSAALKAIENYRGLPHRQQELGEKDGVLYVNDSIATAPHAALAALEVYAAKPVTLIAGGYDRGVDYNPLADYIIAHKTNAVICLGPSGKRIYDALTKQRRDGIFTATSMAEAIGIARQNTPKGGVILLSPAAPSFGLFRDYAERGERFAEESGFKTGT